ncbi:hypothetical protein AB4Z45_11410 [Paenibacillus sp. MCAF9]|uniref:hypothetical protein n=1 Tax=Paenibacillus sp. TAF43_2 TaxID=3233069 RepID=UPI003F98A40A
MPTSLLGFTDREGQLKVIIGMSVREIQGAMIYNNQEIPFHVKGNEYLTYENSKFSVERAIGVVNPTYR